MITQKDIKEILKDYDPTDITIAVLGGHSALDVCSGAKEYGFKTLAVCKKGREKTYAKYYKTREDGRGCIDEVLLVDEFSDIVKEDVQKKLRDMNAIFIHNRYFWVYFKDFKDIEEKFMVPIYGIREGVKLEERDVPKNQYYLLEKAGIQLPKIVREGDSGMNEDDTRKVLDEHFDAKGGPLIIKVNEAIRSYERAFFVITNTEQYFETSSKMIEDG
ncbi:MAG: DUF1246 domain-containing protein, partial [Candidatus Scalindua sp.]|nr:DUF1246 domain-containing protein [Candidatus Scalindua sp.]